jgi:hypothetical protein
VTPRCFEPEQPVPQHVPGLRVQARGRLVQQQNLRLVDQRPGDRQPPPHPAGQHLDLLVRLVPQLREVERRRRPLPDHRPAQAEVAAVDDQILPYRQLPVQTVVLRYHTQPRPYLRSLGGGVHAEHPQGPAADRRRRADHPHGAGLARTVGPEEAEGFPAPQLEVDSVDRPERGGGPARWIDLGKAIGLDERAVGHPASVRRRYDRRNRLPIQCNFLHWWLMPAAARRRHVSRSAGGRWRAVRVRRGANCRSPRRPAGRRR